VGLKKHGEIVDKGCAFDIIDVDDKHGEAFFHFQLDHCDIAQGVVDGLEGPW
jgi:hypothetical protein